VMREMIRYGGEKRGTTASRMMLSRIMLIVNLRLLKIVLISMDLSSQYA
jgi:hypothetical protein